MATGDEQWLKEDGYLNIEIQSKCIVFHPALNVILVFTESGEVTVLDVNSGVILQTVRISEDLPARCRYLPDQDRMLFWNGRQVAMRGDYSGVLLLDTILQAPVAQADDTIRLELPLSEAIIFLQCMQNLEQHGLQNTADVTNELTQKIAQAQQQTKRGIKAQKWETICLELPHSALRVVAGGMVMLLKGLDRHIPALAISSAINERLTDLLQGARSIPTLAGGGAGGGGGLGTGMGGGSSGGGGGGGVNRFHMFSEATRRETFKRWPHMDYKWVLPDQMAQAGFYHYPGDAGNDDRAMCFTCNVCLVCWERTDEPWSEHERHSPDCPFVKGEFTPNVPLAVTYATSPASAVDPPGFEIVSSGERGNVFCTGRASGEITVWNLERQLARVYEFRVQPLDLSRNLTMTTTTSSLTSGSNVELELTALCAYRTKSAEISAAHRHRMGTLSLKPGMLGTKIVAGVRVTSRPSVAANSIATGSTTQHLALIVYNIEDLSPCEPEFPTLPSKTSQIISTASTTDGTKHHFLKYGDDLIKFLSDNTDSQLLESLDKLMTLTEENVLSKNKEDKESSTGGIISKLIEASGPSAAEKLSLTESTIAASVPDVVAAVPESGLVTGGTATTLTSQVSTSSSHGSDDISCIPAQCIELPIRELPSGACYHIRECIPSSDNRYLLVVLERRRAPPLPQEYEMKVLSSSSTDEADENQVKKENTCKGSSSILYLFQLGDDGLLVRQGGLTSLSEPLEMHLSEGEAPLEIVMLPSRDSNGRCFGGPETEHGIFVMTCADGRLRLVALKTLTILAEASAASGRGSSEGGCGDVTNNCGDDAAADDRFVSAAYCKSLERLCGCTAKGCLHFYSFYELDADSSGDERDDELTTAAGVTIGSIMSTGGNGNSSGSSSAVVRASKFDAIPSTSSSTSHAETIPLSMSYGGSTVSTASASSSATDLHPELQQQQQQQQPFLIAYKSDLSGATLRTMYSLTQFSELLTPYSAEVPACWSELEQAQKQRRHPQHLRPGDDTHLAKTWRLHNDATTWDEHLIELNLPKCSSLGHIDFKFSLYQPCSSPPAIQVTLLKQKSIGLCSRRKTAQSINRVDESINFNIGSADEMIENPVLSEEYLQARNAEILVGPIELASCMDLSEQAGSVTLTSPKLLKSKGRNYLLHIKTMTDLSKDGQAKTRGCDWLNEISITLRSTRPVFKVEHERAQRLAMLESNMLLESLLRALYAPAEDSLRHQQSIIFDVLIWIVTIRLKRYRYPRNPFAKKSVLTPSAEIREVASADMNVQQAECVQIIERHLAEIMRVCIVLANRSVAHKCVKLICVALEGAQNMPDKDVCSSFEQRLKEAIVASLPEIVHSVHAGALRWFTLLISGCSSVDSAGPITERCIELLTGITREMYDRSNPYTALLKTRFGLYGSPFEAEVFDAQPLAGGRNPHLAAMASLGGGGGSAASISSAYPACSITKTTVVAGGSGPGNGQSIDLRSVCIADGSELKFLPLQLRRRGIGVHFKGLLEVEPLHYVCSGTSDATRLENVDAATSIGGGIGSGVGGSGSVQQQAVAAAAAAVAAASATANTSTNIIDDFLMDGGGGASGIVIGQHHPGANALSAAANLDAAVSSGSSMLQNHIKHDHEMLDKDDNLDDDMMNNVKNVLVDKLFYSALKKHKLKDNFNEAKKSAAAAAAAHAVADEVSAAHQKLQQLLQAEVDKGFQDIKSCCWGSLNDSAEVEDSGGDGDDGTAARTVFLTSPMVASTAGAAKATKQSQSSIIMDGDDEEEYSSQHQHAPDGLNNKIQEFFDTTAGPSGESTPLSGLPWHKLLSAPPKQVIVVERMHSGAVRYVTLDFGAPVMLTDAIIPACSDLASLLIDVWCFGEETDSVRLVVSQDIGSRTLVLSDLQPPPICRYLKLTITGRYGMSATRCRIPMGSFYGHIVILDQSEGYAAPEPVMKYLSTIRPSVQASTSSSGNGGGSSINAATTAQLKILNALYEDVHCRYCLAASKLTELLQPLVNSEASNIAHMQAFLARLKAETTNGANGGSSSSGPFGFGALFGELPNQLNSAAASAAAENQKVYAVYDECIAFQHQLNVIARVIDRIRRSGAVIDPELISPVDLRQRSGSGGRKGNNNLLEPASLAGVYTDKLRVLSECLIETMLALITSYGGSIGGQQVAPVANHFTRYTCDLLFYTLVLNGDTHIQLATCSLLVRMCYFQPWWGDFLADKFLTLYSSQNSCVFPQDRVFFLLTYLGRKSIALEAASPSSRSNGSRAIVIDAILKAVATLLAPLGGGGSLGQSQNGQQQYTASSSSIWCNTDLNLLGWILLFLSVCLDDGTAAATSASPLGSDLGGGGGRRGMENPTVGTSAQSSASALRWDFMSGETDMVKARLNGLSGAGGAAGSGGLRTLTRTFKKRFLQGKHYIGGGGGAGSGSSGIGLGSGGSINNGGSSSGNAVAEKMFAMNVADNFAALQANSKLDMTIKHHESQLKKLQNSSGSSSSGGVGGAVIGAGTGSSLGTYKQSFGDYYNEITARGKSATNHRMAQAQDEVPCEAETAFDRGLKAIKPGNIIIVIRGLIGLILAMDFTCNMDLLLITCKIIARLVLACKPTVHLSKIITTGQLLALVRIAVWENQQQPWAVHAITCLLQDVLEADKSYKEDEDEDIAGGGAAADDGDDGDDDDDDDDEDNDVGDSTIQNNNANNDDSGGNSSGDDGVPPLPQQPTTAASLTVDNLTFAKPSASTLLQHHHNPPHHHLQVTKELSYADAVKNHHQLPSLLECDDADMEDIFILEDMMLLEREKQQRQSHRSSVFRKDASGSGISGGTSSFANGRSTGLAILYKTGSSAMDARLEIGLDTNVEITLRRLAMKATFNLIASLPQVVSMPGGGGDPVALAAAAASNSSAATIELEPWPDAILEAWAGSEYGQAQETNAMLTDVFDNILGDLHLVDSWLNLEKILQLWLTLNGETLEQVPGNNAPGLNAYSFPKIPFGDRAVRGLLSALATHPNIKLRAWCLGFQCLILACKPHFEADGMDASTSNSHFRKMGALIVNDDNFERMLLRFFSGVDQSISSLDSNRYAGPTVCKLVVELFIWLELKCNVKDKLKEILLKVILHLVQLGGAISNQQGPIDAQSQLIKELLSFTYDKSDLGMAMSIIESVSHLVYNSIVNVEKLYCYRASEATGSSSMFGTRFGSLFATVLGAESTRQCKTVTDSTLLIDLLKLACILVNTKNPRSSSSGGGGGTTDAGNGLGDNGGGTTAATAAAAAAADGSAGVGGGCSNSAGVGGSGSVPGGVTTTTNGSNGGELNTSSESQTDETKAAEQQQQQYSVLGELRPTIISSSKPPPCYFTDTVLQHTPTMNRLLSSLSHCSNSSFAMLIASSLGEYKSNTSLSEPQTVADAVFQLLLVLNRSATQTILVVKPMFDYINNVTSRRHAMPKLHLSEPFLWFILKVLESIAAVDIFTEMGGIRILCESLVRSNRALINTQPSLVSMIMQRLSKSSNLQATLAGGASSSSSSSSKKSALSAARTEDGLINFAPYCTISSENQTAQPADVLIQAPIASHRRARNPAWSYLFYPNESHVDLTLTLPTAVLLREIQLQPHLSTLASCPSAVAIEITRDSNLGPIPITQPISTVGMTCIRLRFAQPEIATSLIIRLYRPRDATNIGLTQISVLGTTTFSDAVVTPGHHHGSGIGGHGFASSTGGLKVINARAPYDGGWGPEGIPAIGGVYNTPGTATTSGATSDDDRAVQTSLGWLRILAQCFNMGMQQEQLSDRVITAATEVPGFLEACCSLLNIAPFGSVLSLQNLETVLLKLGLHSKEFGLRLINILLRESIPQTFQLCNESISELLYQLCTTANEFSRDRLEAVLAWVVRLYEQQQQQQQTQRRQQQQLQGSSSSSCRSTRFVVLQATNPYSGFMKCLASILWQAHAIELIPDLGAMITNELFVMLHAWIADHMMPPEEPLKKAIDAVLCSMCCIRPELFIVLLRRMGIIESPPADQRSMPPPPSSKTIRPAADKAASITDDSKHEESSKHLLLWIQPASELYISKSELATIAMACQSPLAVQQLIDSKLPETLALLIYEYCHEVALMVAAREPGTSTAKQPPASCSSSSSSLFSAASSSSAGHECMTDTAKEQHQKKAAAQFRRPSSRGGSGGYPMRNVRKVTEIIAFFSEVCSEGAMRDWLGSYEGSCFWGPLLLLLCNNKLPQLVPDDVTPQACLELEETFIRFLSRATTCHPKNQEVLTLNLIAVIRPDAESIARMRLAGTTANFTSLAGGCGGGSSGTGGGPVARTSISGFTRRLVLQILLESEKIMVTIRSDLPLQARDHGFNHNMGGVALSAHPSKRPTTHYLLFYLSTNTKCQDIVDQCSTVYNQLAPSVPSSSLDAQNGATVDIISGGSTSQQQQQQASSSSTAVGTIASGSGGAAGGGSSSSTSSTDNRKELWEMGLGMEFLSITAGVTAKDKRLKEAKNQATTMKQKDILSMFSKKAKKKTKVDDTRITVPDGIALTHSCVPNAHITSDTTIAQILAMLDSVGVSLSTPCLNLNLVETKSKVDFSFGFFTTPPAVASPSPANAQSLIKAADFIPLPSPLQIFSSRGGLSLLAHYLPTVYPETPKPQHAQFACDKDKSPPGGMATAGGAGGDWIKVEQNEEIYEDLDDILADGGSPKTQTISAVPQHSLAAFALFLKLPAYSEVLLRDKMRAQCLLRLILGVTGDGEGNEIYSLALSASLPTLPFEVFRQLLDSSPLTTDDGVLLRRMVIEVGAIHLVLNCLSIFTHHNSSSSTGSTGGGGSSGNSRTSPSTMATDSVVIGAGGGGSGSGVVGGSSSGGKNIPPSGNTANGSGSNGGGDEQTNSDDKSHLFWAKGTGFGTGSTQQSWNVEQALMRQKSEEEHVTVLLQVLSSYINPGDKIPANLEGEASLRYRECSETQPELPPIFLDLLQQSCLIPALSSYLRNDSVLDITRHIPLYRAVLQLLRAISLSNQLVSLLVNRDNESKISIASLLANMKACVDTYASRLKFNKKSNLKGQTQKITVSLDDGDDEGLALLIPDIQETSLLVQNATSVDAMDSEEEQKEVIPRPITKSVEDRYLELMKELQFDTFEMIAETDNGYRFTISHHFETNVRMAGDRGHPGRVKRLAQETVTLSTSLPLSYSSSVFVRCDTDRLDIMKVLITGPADTPYANGCFEFDVYFPPDYPNSPMMINLETTGRNTIRFNPNLYNDGKVCLSVLNTWHGRPEEKWNAHTSSFLQVLVSIQSLILVPEPYFNEPGFERSRGTPTGTHSSREYNSNIYQACVRYAMLEQIKNPCPCFKEVIHTHFWLKRNEICAQIEDWIAELSKPMQNERTGRTISFNAMVLRRQYRQLREELAKLAPPVGLSEEDYPFTAAASASSAVPPAGNNGITTTQTSPTTPNAVTTSTSSSFASATTTPTSGTGIEAHHQHNLSSELQNGPVAAMPVLVGGQTEMLLRTADELEQVQRKLKNDKTGNEGDEDDEDDDDDDDEVDDDSCSCSNENVNENSEEQDQAPQHVGEVGTTSKTNAVSSATAAASAVGEEEIEEESMQVDGDDDDELGEEDDECLSSEEKVILML